MRAGRKETALTTPHPIKPLARHVSMAIALAITVAGCGGDDNDDTPVPPVQPTAAQSCTSLQTLKTSEFDVTGVTTTLVNASTTAPFTVPTTTGTVTTPFCRVEGTAKSNAASNIKFELWLPVRERWNGKFAGTASGGSAGSISYGTLAAHYRLDYASIAHDNGHVSTGFDQTWAYDPATKSLKMEQIVDWASRAQHVVTVVGKQMTSAFYASAPKYAYYNGCSQSGHHGMMEVQRYPDDYDGVIAGAHTSDWTTNMASQAWVAYKQFENNGAGAITKAQYAEVNKAVLAKCDGKPGIDHLVDGVLDDPRLCTFDPAEVQCTGAVGEAATCLKPTQVTALRAMYQGHKTPSGDTVAVPYPVGLETGTFWPTNLTTPTAPQGSWADYIRYPLFVNPNYDFATFNFDLDPLTARTKLRPIYDAFETNLKPFQNRNGKLLMYHGWADSLISPVLSIDYWNAIRTRMGAGEVDKFARMYMIPGVDHCTGGTGTGNFSMMDALANWVEKGVAPDGTTAANTVVASANDGRTRPLCPYPQIAKYKGTGDVKVAANFSCQAP